MRAYKIPTEDKESDGTFEWDSTTMVIVRIYSNGKEGIGYSYTHSSAAKIIKDILNNQIVGRNAMNVKQCYLKMINSVRNLGQTGLCMMAISAVDNALWDLKAKLLELPLVILLGQVKEKIIAYGSGGFTSYSIEKLKKQLGNWAQEGFAFVKMKIGRDPQNDLNRIAAARNVIGDKVKLMVDANEAYAVKQAISIAHNFPELGVIWFEQPVHHNDLEGMRIIKEHCPAETEVASGEYGFNTDDLFRLLNVSAVDVLQADATRCGTSGFLQIGAVCETMHIPLSSHCAPAIHLHPCCSLNCFRHIEYFYDHTRIEDLFFDGNVKAESGFLKPDLNRLGNGLILKEKDASKYEID